MIIPQGNPVPFGRGVTARTTIFADDGNYPLRLIVKTTTCPDFPQYIRIVTVRHKEIQYITLYISVKGKT